MRLRCHCGYEWEYKGGLSRASCPSCGRKVNVGSRFLLHAPPSEPTKPENDNDSGELLLKDSAVYRELLLLLQHPKLKPALKLDIDKLAASYLRFLREDATVKSREKGSRNAIL